MNLIAKIAVFLASMIQPGRIRISVLFLAAFGISSPLLAANETILPHGWNPSVTNAVDYLKSELERWNQIMPSLSSPENESSY